MSGLEPLVDSSFTGPGMVVGDLTPRESSTLRRLESGYSSLGRPPSLLLDFGGDGDRL